MLPEFNEDGNLPVGIHLATFDEFAVRFGRGSHYRQWLLERLKEIVAHANSTHCLERLLIWGSYVTAKVIPGDIDLMLVMGNDFKLDDYPETSKIVFDHSRSRVHFNCDIFWTKVTIDAGLFTMWIDTYQRTKDNKCRGIVEVILNDSK